VGVDPAREPAADRFVRTVTRGRYLTPSDSGAIVVGKAVADRLAADLDDEILATAVGRTGDIESTMLRIVGIVDTGSDEIDAGICQVPLADIERLTGLAGAGEVAIVLKDWKASDTTRAALARSLSGGDLALTWGDISPELKGHLEQDKAMSRAIGAVILLIVFLGVASAQLAAVLERRREFAVLLALGMQGRLMALLLLVEAVAVGGSGAVLGLALGLPIVWRLARVGLDLSTWLGSNYTFQGVVIEPIFYGDIGWWVLWYVFTVAVGATIVASLYPAWFASRTNAADALRVA
jgi:putative ABC transport system permease protein